MCAAHKAHTGSVALSLCKEKNSKNPKIQILLRGPDVRVKRSTLFDTVFDFMDLALLKTLKTVENTENSSQHR